MTKLLWDLPGEKSYETGVQQAVLYVRGADGAYPKGVAWNGVTAVTESPSGAEATPLYADNAKYLNLMSAEEFGGTIEAYMYPDEFAACDGSAEFAQGAYVGQQARKSFGLAYKTLIGNDSDEAGTDYKLHLIYGAIASPSEKAYATVNDSPEAITLSWEFTTTPVPIGDDFKPASCIIIDSRTADPAKLALLEGILFGGSAVIASLPAPALVLTTLGAAAAG